MQNGCGSHAAGRVEAVAGLGAKVRHRAAESLERRLRLLRLFQRPGVVFHKDDAGADSLLHFAGEGCTHKRRGINVKRAKSTLDIHKKTRAKQTHGVEDQEPIHRTETDWGRHQGSRTLASTTLRASQLLPTLHPHSIALFRDQTFSAIQNLEANCHNGQTSVTPNKAVAREAYKRGDAS